MRFSINLDLLNMGGLQILDEKVALPAKFTARFEMEDDHDVEIEIVVVDGKPGARKVTVIQGEGRPPLSGDEFDRIGLARLVKYACVFVAWIPVGPETPEGVLKADTGDTGVWTTYGADEYTTEIRQVIDKRLRRRTVTDKLLHEVAEVYTAADYAPTATVAEHFPVSQSTAGRYVKLARERGFLPPTTRGKST